VVGGYIASSAATVDFVRSCGSGFIFSTSLPPASPARAGAFAMSPHPELRQVSRNAPRAEARLAGPACRFASVTHIVRSRWASALCKRASDLLMDRHSIYVQPINLPDGARGTERLRLTPTPLHSETDMTRLVAACRTSGGPSVLADAPRRNSNAQEN